MSTGELVLNSQLGRREGGDFGDGFSAQMNEIPVKHQSRAELTTC